jgi:hypothetical protein
VAGHVTKVIYNIESFSEATQHVYYLTNGEISYIAETLFTVRRIAVDDAGTFTTRASISSIHHGALQEFAPEQRKQLREEIKMLLNLFHDKKERFKKNNEAS